MNQNIYKYCVGFTVIHRSEEEFLIQFMFSLHVLAQFFKGVKLL